MAYCDPNNPEFRFYSPEHQRTIIIFDSCAKKNYDDPGITALREDLYDLVDFYCLLGIKNHYSGVHDFVYHLIPMIKKIEREATEPKFSDVVDIILRLNMNIDPSTVTLFLEVIYFPECVTLYDFHIFENYYILKKDYYDELHHHIKLIDMLYETREYRDEIRHICEDKAAFSFLSTQFNYLLGYFYKYNVTDLSLKEVLDYTYNNSNELTDYYFLNYIPNNEHKVRTLMTDKIINSCRNNKINNKVIK